MNVKSMLLGAALFVGGGAIGVVASRRPPVEPGPLDSVNGSSETLCQQTNFVNPDFACGREHVISKAGYATLVTDLEQYIRTQQSAGHVTEVGVYFRDMRSGPVFGINENLGFVPASLLKLPVMLGFYEMAESGTDVLSTQLVYSPATLTRLPVPDQHESAETGLVVGQSYPIRDLVRAVLEQSDNLAFVILLEYLNYSVPDGIDRGRRILRELGIVDPRDQLDEVITPRGYASVLRSLYNSSYLSVEHSELLLSWLAASTFDQGLAAGLPEGTPVANKFGERSVDGVTLQLHDCGVVYFPGNPYTLCVMTKGDGWDNLVGVIATISRMVYEEVDSRRL
jgi:beta-lactamase class A